MASAKVKSLIKAERRLVEIVHLAKMGSTEQALWLLKGTESRLVGKRANGSVELKYLGSLIVMTVDPVPDSVPVDKV